MIVIKSTEKDVATAVADLTAAVEAKGYSVLQTYDLRGKMRDKGVEFANACQILEVCNPQRAAAVLEHDMRISMALPCRICVYEDQGKVIIGTLRPSGLIGVFSEDAALAQIATEVEEDILAMVAEAI